MAEPAFLACDWGTTNLRAWVVGDDGEVVASRDFPLGVGHAAFFQICRSEIRLAFDVGRIVLRGLLVIRDGLILAAGAQVEIGDA